MRAIGYACIIVGLFSGFVLVSRLGLATSLSLPDLAALRFGIGALVLLPVLLVHGFGGVRAGEALGLAVLGGLGFALFAYAGFALAPAAHGAVLLHGTLALTTAALVSVFGLGIARPGRRIGLALVACGVAAMAWDGLSHASVTMLAGDACLLAASLCWSGYALYVKRLGVPAPRAAAIVAFVSAALFLPVYAVIPGKLLLAAPWRDIVVQGVFQGVLLGAVSIFVYTRAVAALGAATVSMFTAAVPGVTTVAGFVLLDEVPSLASAAGVVLVTLGMATALRSDS